MDLDNEITKNLVWTQWNKPIDRKVKLTVDCTDHPDVSNVSYDTIHDLLGTSGCSNSEPYWDWSVLGVLKDHLGNRLVVCPGDWIVTNDYITTVISNEVVEKLELTLRKLNVS